ncbi:MAG: hypothetical protein Q8914_11700 [Bacteroidota bacterium]|nr:hypothetical protein [Bacteroidota bacterium]
MENNPFDFDESLAVARLIWILIDSDNNITNNESAYFRQSLEWLNITQKEIEDYLQLPEEEAFEVVRNMPSKKRSECATLLRLAFNSDFNMDRVELSKLNELLTRAELFRPDKNSPDRDAEMII